MAIDPRAPAAGPNGLLLQPAVLRDRLDRDGGFTIEVRTGATVRRGIAVCLQPWCTWTFRRAQWRDEAVAGWLRRLVASEGPGAIGGWMDDGVVWLDRVHVVPEVLRPVASMLGRRRGQRGVFDLRRKHLVRLRTAP